MWNPWAGQPAVAVQNQVKSGPSDLKKNLTGASKPLTKRRLSQKSLSQFGKTKNW